MLSTNFITNLIYNKDLIVEYVFRYSKNYLLIGLNKILIFYSFIVPLFT
jgi:hypothetical protein